MWFIGTGFNGNIRDGGQGTAAAPPDGALRIAATGGKDDPGGNGA